MMKLLKNLEEKFLKKLCDGNLGNSVTKDYANLLKELYNKES